MNSIAATTAVVYSSATLPPTFNKLDTQQRTRLIRTARKLGAVLGSTPRLVDVEGERPQPIPIVLPSSSTMIGLRSGSSTTTKKERRYGSIYLPRSESPDSFYSVSSTNSSVVSLALPESEPQSSVEQLPMPKSFSGRRSTDAPRPLVLRLNVTPPTIPSNESTPSSSAPPTVTSSRFGCNLQNTTEELVATPTTPAAPTASELRRKRMAKLARTFGENVPPELVFSHNDAVQKKSIDHSPYATTGRRHRRVVSIIEDPAAVCDGPKRSSRIWVTGNGSWTGEWNRKDIKEVQDQLRKL
ncbi:hypothetical protein ABKN59_008090 [Abortiporus biennis]